ncbi:MAG: ArnT family glycosyltransferase [Limisphaerales bacterium]
MPPTMLKGDANSLPLSANGKDQPDSVLPVLLLMALTLACLLPFLNKAIHIDDPLFIWTALQIRSHPLDFYGFLVDWDRQPLPMPFVMQNPPLTGYYMAAVGSVLGWSEIALHFGFLLPALALVTGTYCLARHFCAHPVTAALGLIAAPVFLLCGTSLMCDTMMVALWVWAMYFWLEGLRLECARRLFLAALLISAASLTKYFGACLVPLLFVYTMMRLRRPGVWLLCLLLPILVLSAYQALTSHLYGNGLVTNAFAYASRGQVGGGLASKLMASLAFTGGCVFLPLAAAPSLWGRKVLAACGVGTLALALLFVSAKKVGMFSVADAGSVKWLAVAQIALFACGGALALILAAADIITRKETDSVFLFLWTIGTFLFASAVNWTVSGRNILPLAPVVSILIVRRLELIGAAWGAPAWPDRPKADTCTAARPDRFRLLRVPLAISLAVGLTVAWGDWKLAESARTAAVTLQQQYGPHSSEIAFEGHWGFQYYMESFGAKALNAKQLDLVSNEVIIMPQNNTHGFPLPDGQIETLAQYHGSAAGWLALMSRPLGAGYYSDHWGPAPFIFGSPPTEDYAVFRVK